MLAAVELAGTETPDQANTQGIEVALGFTQKMQTAARGSIRCVPTSALPFWVIGRGMPSSGESPIEPAESRSGKCLTSRRPRAISICDCTFGKQWLSDTYAVHCLGSRLAAVRSPEPADSHQCQ